VAETTEPGTTDQGTTEPRTTEPGTTDPETTGQKSMAIPLTAFAVGAVVALLVGVFGRVHDPTLQGTTDLGYSTVLAMKTVVATVVAVLVVVQVGTALWIYGKLGIRAPSWLGTAHRITGATALVLSLFIAYHCLWSLGLEVGTLPDGAPVSTRTLVHGLIGCAVIGAMVVKVVAVRSRRAPGWFLPVAGGVLFSLLVLAILTSAVWYIGQEGWPTRAG
jgi:hypothetical protein